MRSPDEEQVLSLARRVIAAQGAELLEGRLFPNRTLRLVLDRDGAAVDAALLIAVLKGVRRAFHDEDLDPEDFNIEVDSPGEHRVLTTVRHFERFQGSRIQVTLRPRSEGKATLTMLLLGAQDGAPWIRTPDGSERRLSPDEFETIRLA